LRAREWRWREWRWREWRIQVQYSNRPDLQKRVGNHQEPSDTVDILSVVASYRRELAAFKALAELYGISASPVAKLGR
jgi:hypothetical protein